MNFILLILSLCSAVLCIYDDQLNKIDWIQQQIGSFIAAPTVYGTVIYGVTDTALFAGLSTVDGSVKFRYDVGGDAVLSTEENGKLVVVQYTKSVIEKTDTYELDVYSDAVLVDSVSKVATGAITPRPRTWKHNDKVLVSTGAELEVFDSDSRSLKSLKLSVKDIQGDKILASDNQLYQLSADLKLHKTAKAHAINPHGYAALSGQKFKFKSFDDSIGDTIDVDHCSHYVLTQDTLITITPEQIAVYDPELMAEYDSIANFFLSDSTDIYRVTTTYRDTFYTLVERFDGVIEYYRGSQLIWTRDESLAHTIAFIVLDAAPRTLISEEDVSLEANANLASAFWHRLTTNLRKLHHAITTKGDTAVDEEEQHKLSYFGLDKRLVSLTASGKLHVFDIEHKSLKWTKKLSQNYTDVVADTHDLQGRFYVVDKGSGNWVHFDLNGELISAGNGTEAITDIFRFDSRVVLAHSSGQVTVLGDELIEPRYAIQYDSGSIYGIVVTSSEVSRTWSVPLEGSETVVAMAQRPDPNNDNVASVGVVLGDRRVLYKYLVPNLAVAAVHDSETDALQLRLLSVITGEVLLVIDHSVEFIDITSFQLLYDENFIVYSYYSYVPSMEQKIVVVDMFESLTPNGRTTHGKGQSQFDSVITAPAIASRSFNFPDRISSIVTTRTRFNIATKTIVAALRNGQLVAIPKYVLNGRRPYAELTPAEKGEAHMSRYSSEIVVADTAVLSNIHIVKPDNENLEVVSVATGLESTTVVCAVGIDLYCTKFSPSGEFDVLGNKIDKWQLLGTIAILAGGVVWVKPMVVNKRLNSQWIIN